MAAHPCHQGRECSIKNLLEFNGGLFPWTSIQEIGVKILDGLIKCAPVLADAASSARCWPSKQLVLLIARAMSKQPKAICSKRQPKALVNP